MTIESGEIIWVHPDIVQDEQWETSKSCNAISLATNDDSVVIASLSDSEREKLALVTQPATSHSVDTRSGKQYLRQYDQTPDRAPPQHVGNHYTCPGPNA